MTTLQEAFKEALYSDYANGMATNPVTVERETETVEIIRKAGNLDRPPIFLLIAKPNYEYGIDTPDIESLESDIGDVLGLYGDIDITFQERERGDSRGEYDCIFPIELF